MWRVFNIISEGMLHLYLLTQHTCPKEQAVMDKPLFFCIITKVTEINWMSRSK
jgi:uncharacterized membrane protein YhfC